ncbi:hypothetical protein [Streptomyces sp. C1-2]|uniref:hypothetical protein n=1 Tax=Streptomyces sp. C1-2 TaxID=2720022 RepID=UPI0014326ACF|nr:hypothetical protein [Streptomyces sp. C1-2]NJP74940.1 hypothetical protein [Streptomyces sp. C1-2]
MARFEVHISDEGLATIDGEPITLAPGRSAHEVVLDQLQRYAIERAGAVEAIVNEGPDTGHFVLEVLPDGSSRLLDSEEATPLAFEQEAEAGSEHEPEPTFERTTASVTAIATAVARATTAARAVAHGSATQAPAVHLPVTHVPAAVAAPAELAGQISRINALARADRLDEAYDLASDLRERLTEENGSENPHAVEARAMEAYIAHLCGDHREAVVLALAVARIRCRTGDPRAPEDVARAAAAWQCLDEDRAVVTHGHELLLMWDRLNRRGQLPPAHVELAKGVRRQVEEREVLV